MRSAWCVVASYLFSRPVLLTRKVKADTETKSRQIGSSEMVLLLREAMRAIASLCCEGAMRAIASSISQHASPQQGSTPIISAATAGGIATVQTASAAAAAKTLPTTPTREGKSPQGSKVTVQIEQYLLYSAVQLTSCSSPAATASWLISSMLPHVSLGASQLLKPASTTLRSYGRRQRSWHYEPQAQTNC